MWASPFFGSFRAGRGAITTCSVTHDPRRVRSPRSNHVERRSVELAAVLTIASWSAYALGKPLAPSCGRAAPATSA
jgi:hypothetical protein